MKLKFICTDMFHNRDIPRFKIIRKMFKCNFTVIEIRVFSYLIQVSI